MFIASAFSYRSLDQGCAHTVGPVSTQPVTTQTDVLRILEKLDYLRAHHCIQGNWTLGPILSQFPPCEILGSHSGED